MKFSIVKYVLITLGLTLGWISTAYATATTEKFLSIADIHFTPFASCPIAALKPCPLVKKLMAASANDWKNILEEYDSKTVSPYHKDTNYALLKSALQEIHNTYQTEHPRFSLILGDFLAHGYREHYILFARDRSKQGYEQFVEKTLEFLTTEIRAALPEGDIYPAVGNNDSYTGNYRVVERGAFFTDIANVWSTLISDETNRENFRQAFPRAGYYAVSLPSNRNLRILVLNTVLFSIEAKGPHLQSAAQTQLNWLHQQLLQATKAHQKVLLAFHIPIGVDVYKTVKSPFGGIKEFWHASYSTQFQNDLLEFAETIVGILPGHIHMDGFQLAGFNKPKEIPISFTPAISPIYGNNPGFKVFSYDPISFQLKNFETFFLPLSEEKNVWKKEYNFNQTYQSSCENCDLTSGMNALTPVNNLVNFYKDYYAVSNHAQPITKTKNWGAYWCGAHTFFPQDYQDCLRQG